MSVVLSEHLPLLATAPGGIQKLRGLILDLAMRGKLVAQEQSDEPAVNLLEKIEQERIRLETEGVYKKSKPLPPKPDCVPAYRLPNTWTWVRLGDVTNFGQTDKDGRLSNETWVLDLEDIQKDTSVLLNRVRFAERQATSDKNRFKTGDVLYGKLRPYLNKVIVADEDGACTTEILPVRGYYGIAPRYLMYALKRPEFISYVNSKSYGMKMPRLGTEDGRNALFPLAPLAAQHRIVTKVDELMALCERLEAEQSDAELAHARLVESLLDTLTQSTDAADLASNWRRIAGHFDILFTTERSIDNLKHTTLQLAVMGKLVRQDPTDEPASQLLTQIERERTGQEFAGTLRKSKSPLQPDLTEFPFTLPSGWKWSSLASVASINPRNSAHDADVASFVSMAMIGTSFSGEHLQESRKWSEIKQGFTHFAEGDIGVAKITPCFENSKACVFSNLQNRIGAGTTELHIVRLIGQTLDPKYVLAYLKSPMFLSVGETKMTGTAGQKRLPKDFLETNPFPLPPLAEQHRVVARLEELMTLFDRMKIDLSEARFQQSRLAATLIETALENTQWMIRLNRRDSGVLTSSTVAAQPRLDSN